MVDVGRPDSISCKRCGTTVSVKAKGPVPSYCAGCRKGGSAKRASRPRVVACERCGREVDVKSRGPLPRFCRDGCPAPSPLEAAGTAQGSAPQLTASIQSSPDQTAVIVPAGRRDPKAPAGPSRVRSKPPGISGPRVRPARTPERAEPRPSEAPTAGTASATTAEPASSASPTPSPLLVAAEAEGPTILATVPLPSSEDALRRGRRARIRRVRNVVSIGLWILAILVIVFVFLIGSRPSPPPNSLGIPIVL